MLAFINGIRNLIKWFPIIWRDRDWDYYYIFELLQYKLQLMEDHHRNDAIAFVGQNKVIRQLKICKNLAKRLRDDDYCLFPHVNFLKTVSVTHAVNYTEQLVKNDKELLFKLMDKHILKWWD